MAKCTNCGFEAPDTALRCPECDSALAHAIAPTRSGAAPALAPVRKESPPPAPNPAVPKPAVAQKFLHDVTDYKVLLDLADQGFELYAIAGASQHGKSEFMAALIIQLARIMAGDSTSVSDAFRDDTGAALKTPPHQFGLWSQPVKDRKIAVWDMAGEDFDKIGTRIFDAETDLKRMLLEVLPRCRGIILNIALHKLWAQWNAELLSEDNGESPYSSADRTKRARDQEELRKNLDRYAAFLNFIKIAENAGGKSSVFPSQTESQSILARAPMLEQPVAVCLSMADKYRKELGDGRHVKLRTAEAELPYDLRDANGDVLKSIPIGADDDPLSVAYLYLNHLFAFLKDNVRWFKFDFTQAKVENHPLGLRSSRGCFAAYLFLAEMNWLSNDNTGAIFERYRKKSRAEWRQRLDVLLTREAL